MEKKKVAVFIADIYAPMIKEIQYGLIQCAKRSNVKLYFYTSFNDDFTTREYTQFTEYDKGDFVAYMLPDYDEYDGIITFDSCLPSMYLDKVNDIKKKAKCPTVSLGEEYDFSYTVTTDQTQSFINLIDHLYDVHGCREMVHIAGRKSETFTQIRIDAFKAGLEKHNLPYDDSHVIYGTLWKDCGEPVVQQLLEKYKTVEGRILPDAIICANDFTAIGVIDALKARGYKVPGDVIVTGYDNVEETQFGSPTITTLCQPFEQIGKECLKILKKVWEGKPTEKVFYEPGDLITRQSCGCEPINFFNQSNIREKYARNLEGMGYLAKSNTALILSTSESESEEDIFNQIESICLRDTGFKSAVFCLMDDWDKQVVITSQEELHNKNFSVICGMYNDKKITRGPLPKGQYIPDEMKDDISPFYFFPIHHLKYFMGYIIVIPELENVYQQNLKSWLVNIGTIFDNFRIRQILKQTVLTLENLYNKDTLTGLYNRRGYELNFKRYYKDCLESDSCLAVFVLDMDNLKYVNDNYGHEEGDYCLRTIGDAMKEAAQNDEICIRSGGDEFVILAKNYDDKKAEKLCTTIKESIKNKCINDKKPFIVSVSIGCHLQVPPKVTEDGMNTMLEAFLKKADALMYVEKKEHKKDNKS